jgi:hypothetical protein
MSGPLTWYETILRRSECGRTQSEPEGRKVHPVVAWPNPWLGHRVPICPKRIDIEKQDEISYEWNRTTKVVGSLEGEHRISQGGGLD